MPRAGSRVLTDKGQVDEALIKIGKPDRAEALRAHLAGKSGKRP